MVPLDAVVSAQPMSGPALITAYDLYPAATVIGAGAPGISSGQAMAADGADRPRDPAARRRIRLDGDVVSGEGGRQSDHVRLRRRVDPWSIWCSPANTRAGTCRSPSVLGGAACALAGPVLVLSALGVANNLYTQIGLVLLVALAAKNAILIVAVAREERVVRGAALVDAAVTGAQTRFRAIVMTSLAFGLGVLPLLLAEGAGANARRSIGIAVFTGMISATCLGTLAVPAFFVVVQRLGERLSRPAPSIPARRAPAVHEETQA